MFGDSGLCRTMVVFIVQICSIVCLPLIFVVFDNPVDPVISLMSVIFTVFLLLALVTSVVIHALCVVRPGVACSLCSARCCCCCCCCCDRCRARENYSDVPLLMVDKERLPAPVGIDLSYNWEKGEAKEMISFQL